MPPQNELSREDGADRRTDALCEIPVDRIRPEDGLGRRRDRAGHQDLCRSIEQFGVLTPITVRPAPDDSGEYLLIKGQGRTLACRLLGMTHIPAIVVDESRAEQEKVQQFLVENVARLRLASVDRALLIARARRDGEETAAVAARFGVHPQTVRRLEAQLDGVTAREAAVLQGGKVNLALHAVISRHARPDERAAMVEMVDSRPIKSSEMDQLLTALDWRGLGDLPEVSVEERMGLLWWALGALKAIPKGPPKERVRALATLLPVEIPSMGRKAVAG